jgi:hypothetical protein
MAHTFFAQVDDPNSAFARLSVWARSQGVSLSGDASSGRFSGRPPGLAALLYPVISGRYELSGNRLTIVTDQDLPANEVGKRLNEAGLRSLGSQ